MTNPVQTYKRPARWIHWLMALFILPMIVAGFIMIQEGIPRPLQNTLFLFHKNVGVLMLLMITVRLFYRAFNPAPPEPDHLPAWQVRLASLTHWLLYALLVVMPLSGYIRVRAGGFPIETLDALGVPALVPRSDQLADLAQNVHFYAGYAITALIALHILAALQHAIIKRDGVFSRMWPSRNPTGVEEAAK